MFLSSGDHDCAKHNNYCASFVLRIQTTVAQQLLLLFEYFCLNPFV